VARASSGGADVRIAVTSKPEAVCPFGSSAQIPPELEAGAVEVLDSAS
jgi:hypothetical protein